MPPASLIARRPNVAVRPGARQHDADRPRPLVGGERAEEVVDRQMRPVRAGIRAGVITCSTPCTDRQVRVGRNDVDAVGSTVRPSRGGDDLDVADARQQRRAGDCRVWARGAGRRRTPCARDGRLLSSAVSASKPPADAPTPTMKKLAAVSSALAGCSSPRQRRHRQRRRHPPRAKTPYFQEPGRAPSVGMAGTRSIFDRQKFTSS